MEEFGTGSALIPAEGPSHWQHPTEPPPASLPSLPVQTLGDASPRKRCSSWRRAGKPSLPPASPSRTLQQGRSPAPPRELATLTSPGTCGAALLIPCTSWQAVGFLSREKSERCLKQAAAAQSAARLPLPPLYSDGSWTPASPVTNAVHPAAAGHAPGGFWSLFSPP